MAPTVSVHGPCGPFAAFSNRCDKGRIDHQLDRLQVLNIEAGLGFGLTAASDRLTLKLIGLPSVRSATARMVAVAMQLGLVTRLFAVFAAVLSEGPAW